jgi:hypothetical protein
LIPIEIIPSLQSWFFPLEKGDGIEMNKSIYAHYHKLAADQGYAMARVPYEEVIAGTNHSSIGKELDCHVLVPKHHCIVLILTRCR